MNNKHEGSYDGSQSEHRKFKRIDGTYIVSYAPIKGDELKFDVSQTRNVSEGGLLFISDRKFEKDTVLKIKLRLPELPDYAIVQAQVIDSVKMAKGMMYGTRARFINVEQKVKDAIKRLVENV